MRMMEEEGRRSLVGEGKTMNGMVTYAVMDAMTLFYSFFIERQFLKAWHRCLSEEGESWERRKKEGERNKTTKKNKRKNEKYVSKENKRMKDGVISPNEIQ